MMIKTTKTLYMLLLSFQILAVILIYILSMKPLGKLYGQPLLANELIAFASTARSRSQQTILLLLYNEFLGEKDWFRFNEDCHCVKNKVEITHDKRRFLESDFVLVHVASNLPSLKNLKTMRRQRPSWQRWIYYSMESPMSESSPNTRRLGDMFDLTFTYRVDSDFWAPYGTYEEIPFVNLSHQDFSAGKDKLVAWIVSNCEPPLRKLFVRELQKYITVDVFGSCSGTFEKSVSCPRDKTCKGIIKQYKFYLSFENALCEDYITEKYWGHLGEEYVVPIVLGGANYTKLAIPGSYINVLDFKTVKDLADYLHYLDKNNTAYNEYFKWKQKYRAVWLSDFCAFCEVLSSKIPKGHADLSEFWLTQGKCNEKDQLVLSMWTPPIKFPAYLAVLMTSILTLVIIIALLVYFSQIYRVSPHHESLDDVA